MNLHSARLPATGLALVLALNCSGFAAIAAERAPETPTDHPTASTRLPIRISWGHRTAGTQPFRIELLAQNARATGAHPVGFETTDRLEDGVCLTRAGDGDVDGLEFELDFTAREIGEIQSVQQIWRYLLEHSDADTAQRLRQDPGYRPDPRKLTLQMDAAGTQGFSLTVDQLLRQHTFWVPELDVFVSAGEPPVSFSEHLAALKPWRGYRVLDEVAREPEPSYADFTSRWEDMGSPAYANPHSVGPGHIVCLAWDSTLAKFGIDRGGNVGNDYGNPDHFGLEFDFGALTPDLVKTWRGQRLTDGLPVVTTTVEKNGVRYELEQFAYPLKGPPPERRGDLPMVLLQRLTLRELTGKAHTVALHLTHRRELAGSGRLSVRQGERELLWENTANGSVLLTVQGGDFALRQSATEGDRGQTNRSELGIALPADGARGLILRLPSAPVPPAELATLLGIDLEAARTETLAFWSNWIARGAQFDVPDEAVNTLFRASLWHARRLPRRPGGAGLEVKIDLPYSNFAYDQHGTPWPVNQAVYVDSMLYDLRGYHDVAAEELAVMFRNNQEPGGHVGGFANWGVYTPSMIYAVAHNYLLSGDRAAFARLLPQTLKAFDWCQDELRTAAEREGPTAGLVLAPLNDLSHAPQAWAFNQAYLFAGPDLLARALAEIGHPRAAEVRATAQALFAAVQRGFAHASMLSPLVQLRDHTWIPFVPGDALTPHRCFDLWYPTDVDTGPLHLSRLKALDPTGPLTTCLLLDHEDNLFYKQRGMANEPVYNQQALAYLWRDEPQPAIRAFYSMLACAFSHTVFEPVEHRWGWGQYFGPPSTDGAWFELYRNMLVQERDDDSLWLCAATPRRWLEDGKRIRVERAPTCYGPVSLTVESHAASGTIIARFSADWRKRPAALLLRLRHPAQKPLRSVRVNGQPWSDFDARKEWVRIPNPTEAGYLVTAEY